MIYGKNYQLEDLVGEVWKPIPMVNDYYLVSNKGRVKALSCSNHKKVMVMHQHKNQAGYYTVGLRMNGKSKTWPVHRLVALAFLPQPDCMCEVNHKDENPANNCVENLEWCSHSYNMTYGTLVERAQEKNTNHISTSKKVGKYTLDGELVGVYPSVREVKRQENFKGFKSIYECCAGRIHSAHGYIWMYVDGVPEKRIPSCKRRNSTAKREVWQYDKNDVFIASYPSITDAAIAIGVNSTNITACCKGKYQLSGGYKWRYANANKDRI